LTTLEHRIAARLNRNATVRAGLNCLPVRWRRGHSVFGSEGLPADIRRDTGMWAVNLPVGSRGCGFRPSPR
jgi:hypothetical protein